MNKLLTGSGLVLLWLTSNAVAQEIGRIKREIPNQVGVYEMSGSTTNISSSDIVTILRNGKRLGEATVTKVSPTSLILSLKGNFPVSTNDVVEFSRKASPTANSAADGFIEIGSEGNGALSHTFYLDSQQVTKLDKNSCRVRVKVGAKSKVYTADPVLNSSFFLWLDIYRDGTFQEANEIVSTAYIKDTGEPQIGPWKERRRIERGSWQATLYKTLFPDEKT